MDVKIKSFFQINPHLFFKNYNVSIWIDTDKIKKISGDTTEYVRLIDPKHFLLTLNSSTNDCAYVELISKFKNNKIKNYEYDSILQLYRWFRYPQKNGFINTSLLIRKHNDERCKLVMNKIWKYICKYNLPETLFFNLSLWYFKYGYSFIPDTLFYKKYIEMRGNDNGCDSYHNFN